MMQRNTAAPLLSRGERFHPRGRYALCRDLASERLRAALPFATRVFLGDLGRINLCVDKVSGGRIIYSRLKSA